MMSMTEEDLLSALTELYEASQAMTSGMLHSAEDMERYYLALSWAERLIRLHKNPTERTHDQI